MKMHFAGILPNPNAVPEKFRYNCTRNKSCEHEFYIPVSNLCDFMLYFELPFMPETYEVKAFNCCTGDEVSLNVLNYVVGTNTTGYYAVFGGFTAFGSSFFFEYFYIKISFFNSEDVEAVYFSNDFELVTCEALTSIKACYNDPALVSEAYDMNGVYYGFPVSGAVLGNPLYRYYHFLKVRKGAVYGSKTKISLSAFNYSKVYKGQTIQQYNFFSESVPEFYKDEIVSVLVRGNILINDKPYQLAEEIDLSINDEDSRRWQMLVTLNKTIFSFFSCKATVCNFDPCAVIPVEPETCCDPTVNTGHVVFISGTTNQITLNFTACDPAPSGGYNVFYRPLGSGIAYRDGGNFTSSPAIINDTNDVEGTEYQGYIYSVCAGSEGAHVPFEAHVTAIPEIGLVCGDLFSLTHEENNYFVYPIQNIIIYGGQTVNINYDSFDRPNRFSIYKDGSLLVTSGWKGYAPYPGMWGASLSTASSGSISYVAEPGHTYQLYVEAGNGNPSAPLSDGFNVLISCEETVYSRPACLLNIPSCTCPEGVITIYYLGNPGMGVLPNGTIIYSDPELTTPITSHSYVTAYTLYYTINPGTGAITFAGAC